MAAKVTEDRPSLGSRQAAAALPSRDGGKDFNGCDAGEINRVRRLGTGQGSDPGGASLSDMSFDECTGVQELTTIPPKYHLADPPATRP